MKKAEFKYQFFISFLLIFLLTHFNLNAQYFGRNKVQYDEFNFKEYVTENFKILYYERETAAAMDAGIFLERWDNRFSKIFGKSIGPDQPIILYANHADFQQTNVISGFIPQGTGGVTEGLINRITLPFTGIYEENDHVLGHELVHAFQYDIIKSSERGLMGASQIPLWFIEGLAEYLSIGRRDVLTAMWLRDAVFNDDVPSIGQVGRSYKYFPYRYGHAIWNFIASKWGDEMIAPLFRTAIQNGLSAAVDSLLKVDPDTLSLMWENSVKEIYKNQIEGKTKPSETGRSVITEGTNLAPVISPDGKYIALITQNNPFTLDLFLADADNGNIIRQLASSNTDQHFDALRFMNSSGSWSPDGSKFAFVTIRDGDDEIAVVDIESSKIIKQIRVNNVDGITYLSWSPNGRYIALSGTSGGINDLYLYDLDKDVTIQLTDDIYTEIHPDWSPDGKQIAFATDRGEHTDIEEYYFNSMNIGLIDVETREVDLLFIDDGIRHINPRFSPDGSNILMIASPDGISNIYRYSLEDEQFYKVTNIITGITGLTENSDAMSIARNTGEIIFSVFDNTEFRINILEPDELTGIPFTFDEEGYLSAISLPPATESSQGIVSNYINSPDEDLPSDISVYERTEYSPSLHLAYIGQVAVGVAVDRFGTGIGGGVSTYFTDLLGNHELYGALQISGGIKDFGGQAVYLNRSNRWTWGAAIGHIPYLTGYINSRLDTVSQGGNQYLVERIELIRQRIFLSEAALLTQYPLSTNRRFEFSAGYTHVGYDIEQDIYLTDFSGFVFSEETRSLSAPPGLNLFNAAAAYVGDYSFFGFTSPVDGSRFRLEVNPTIGSLNYLTILGDYRRYFFFNPFTLAIRGMHYGRYLGESDNNRLNPLQIGYDTWVRGYNISSFDVSECTTGDCAEVERLIGSRVGIFNLEFRTPLIGTEQFGLINFGFLPTELSLFFDGGVAWSEGEKPILKFAKNSSERIPVFSAGAAFRFNVLGYMVIQVYYAFPFQRPQKDHVWGFAFAPGW